VAWWRQCGQPVTSVSRLREGGGGGSRHLLSYFLAREVVEVVWATHNLRLVFARGRWCGRRVTSILRLRKGGGSDGGGDSGGAGGGIYGS
jgi:hypothetical protein